MTVSWGRRLVSSFLAALTVAVVTHAASMFLFFVSQQYQAATLTQVSGFYFFATLFSVVLLFVFALIGAFTRWYTALIAGFFTGILACLLGTGLTTVLGGFALDAATLSYLWGTFLTLNGVFIHRSVLPLVRRNVGRGLFEGMSGRQRSLLLASGVVSAVALAVPTSARRSRRCRSRAALRSSRSSAPSRSSRSSSA